jgi:hypothetical protein
VYVTTRGELSICTVNWFFGTRNTIDITLHAKLEKSSTNEVALSLSGLALFLL